MRLEKTLKLLSELRKQNQESEYGTPIPDYSWNEVIKELGDCNRKLENYKNFIIGLVVGIIAIYLFI